MPEASRCRARADEIRHERVPATRARATSRRPPSYANPSFFRTWSPATSTATATSTSPSWPRRLPGCWAVFLQRRRRQLRRRGDLRAEPRMGRLWPRRRRLQRGWHRRPRHRDLPAPQRQRRSPSTSSRCGAARRGPPASPWSPRKSRRSPTSTRSPSATSYWRRASPTSRWRSSRLDGWRGAAGARKQCTSIRATAPLPRRPPIS